MPNEHNVELIAAHFTLAGDVYPTGETEISQYSFKDRVEAAAEAGYKGLGLVHEDAMYTVERYGFSEIRNILKQNDIKHFELEMLENWCTTGATYREYKRKLQDLLEVAAEVDVRTIKIGAGPVNDPIDIPFMTDRLRELGEAALKYDTGIMMEIMPFRNLSTINPALEIMKKTELDNVGFMLDIWHLVRKGINFQEITDIPAQYIKGIELNDGPKYTIEPLFADTIHRRCLPGQGTFKINEFIQAVRQTGYTGPWGVEIFSETFRKQPLEIMAQQSFNTSISYLNN